MLWPACFARIGVTLHKREAADMWWSFVRNARRLKPGASVDFGAPVKAMIRELDVAALEVALEGMLAAPHRGSLRRDLEAFAADNDVPLA